MRRHPAASWTPLGAERVFECPVFSIDQENWGNAVLGSEGTFFVLGSRDWVVALALNEHREILMVQQFRFGVRRLTWEFPGGLLDAGECAEVGAGRELLEETGFQGRKAIPLGTMSPNPAIQGNTCHYFLFEGADRVHSGDPDEHESFEVKWIPYDIVRNWALSGAIEHGVVLSGLFLLDAHLRRVEAPAV